MDSSFHYAYFMIIIIRWRTYFTPSIMAWKNGSPTMKWCASQSARKIHPQFFFSSLYLSFKRFPYDYVKIIHHLNDPTEVSQSDSGGNSAFKIDSKIQSGNTRIWQCGDGGEKGVCFTIAITRYIPRVHWIFWSICTDWLFHQLHNIAIIFICHCRILSDGLKVGC